MNNEVMLSYHFCPVKFAPSNPTTLILKGHKLIFSVVTIEWLIKNFLRQEKKNLHFCFQTFYASL